MPVTQIGGKKIADGSITRDDLNVTTSGQAVIRKILQGTGVSVASTGIDTGTGDVTIGVDSVYVRGLFSGSGAIGFNNTTGVISVTTANTSTAGILSAADWNTFNSKASLSGGVNNRVTKWTSATTVGNSTITDDGTNVSLSGALTTGSSITAGGNINGGFIHSFVLTGNQTNYAVGPDSNQLAQNPIAGLLWHDVLAFTTPTAYETSADGTTWTAATPNRSLFAQKENQSVNVIASATQRGARWTFTGVQWSSSEWLVIGHSYQAPEPNKTILVELYNAASSTWTTAHTSTWAGNAAPRWYKLSPGLADNTLMRLTITTAALNTGNVNLASIKLLSSRWGDQGLGSEVQFPYTWDENKNITLSGNLSMSSNTLAAATVNAANISASGNIGATGTITATGALNANGGLNTLNGANLIYDTSGSGFLRIQSWNSKHLSINPLGNNVGIGTTTPTTFKLEVAGDIGPEADNTRSLGSSTKRFLNVYSAAFTGAGTGLTGTAAGLSIGGNAATATTVSSADWSIITNKPTTLAGYGVVVLNFTGVAGASSSTGSGSSASASATITGGAGGDSTWNGSTAQAGKGADLNFVSGAGGSSTGGATNSIGGNGGNINLTGGAGGIASTTTGRGGNIEIAGGQSGTPLSAAAVANGGYVSLKGGNTPATGNGSGGNIYLVPGQGNGTGFSGSIMLGVSPSNVVRGNVVIGAIVDDFVNKLQVAGSIAGVTESSSDNSTRMASTAWVRNYVSSATPAVSWTSITGKPTTVSGYGITDAVLKAGDTMSGALTVNANIGTTGKITIDRGATVDYGLNITTSGVLTSFGSLNASYFHINTAASSGVYFSQNITTPGGVNVGGTLNITKSATTTGISPGIIGGLHLAPGTGTGSADRRQSAITFGYSTAVALAGIYFTNDDATGTNFAISTTQNYGTGAQVGFELLNNGTVKFSRYVGATGLLKIATDGTISVDTGGAGAIYGSSDPNVNANGGYSVAIGATSAYAFLQSHAGKYLHLNPVANDILIGTGASYTTFPGYINTTGRIYSASYFQGSDFLYGDGSSISTRKMTFSDKYLANSYFGLGGDSGDMGMSGLYDRNELTLADKRGVVTVQFTGPGSADAAGIAAMFDASGNFGGFSGTTNATTKIVIHIDLLEYQSNYARGAWQPFVQYRIAPSIGAPQTFYNNVVVEVSPDNVNWSTGPGWQTSDFITDQRVAGIWLGQEVGYQPSALYRYVRFTFTDRRENSSYAYKDAVWVTELGYRHISAPYARQYMNSAGGKFYGPVTFGSTVTFSSAITFPGNLSIGTAVNGGTATPSYIHLGNNYSTVANSSALKVILHDGGYGFTVGGSADVQYHSATYHDTYVANVTRTRVSANGLSVTGNLDATGTITSAGVITAPGGNSAQWNLAYNWGNHASAGYATPAALGLTAITSVSTAKRTGDVLHGIVDPYTAEALTFSKITLHNSGVTMSDALLDGIMYVKYGTEYFKRDYTVLNIRWFGAAGTGTGDDSVGIQKAIDYLQPGQTLPIPEGKWYLLNALRINKPLKVLGAGCGSYVNKTGSYLIQADTSKSAIVLVPTQANYAFGAYGIVGMQFSDIAIWGNSITSRSLKGITVDTTVNGGDFHVRECSFNNVNIAGFQTGIDFIGAAYLNRFYGGCISYCNTGVKFSMGTASDRGGQNRWFGSTVIACTKGFSLNEDTLGGSFGFYGCSISENEWGIVCGSTIDLTCFGNEFEANRTGTSDGASVRINIVTPDNPNADAIKVFNGNSFKSSFTDIWIDKQIPLGSDGNFNFPCFLDGNGMLSANAIKITVPSGHAGINSPSFVIGPSNSGLEPGTGRLADSQISALFGGRDERIKTGPILRRFEVKDGLASGTVVFSLPAGMVVQKMRMYVTKNSTSFTQINVGDFPDAGKYFLFNGDTVPLNKWIESVSPDNEMIINGSTYLIKIIGTNPTYGLADLNAVIECYGYMPQKVTIPTTFGSRFINTMTHNLSGRYVYYNASATYAVNALNGFWQFITIANLTTAGSLNFPASPVDGFLLEIYVSGTGTIATKDSAGTATPYYNDDGTSAANLVLGSNKLIYNAAKGKWYSFK